MSANRHKAPSLRRNWEFLLPGSASRPPLLSSQASGAELRPLFRLEEVLCSTRADAAQYVLHRHTLRYRIPTEGRGLSPSRYYETLDGPRPSPELASHSRSRAPPGQRAHLSVTDVLVSSGVLQALSVTRCRPARLHLAYQDAVRRDGACPHPSPYSPRLLPCVSAPLSPVSEAEPAPHHLPQTSALLPERLAHG